MPDKNKTFIIKANEFSFSIAQKELESIDIIRKSPSEFHLIKNYKSITGTVDDADPSGKKLRVEVDGNIFDIEIKDALDQMLDKMGLGASTGKRIKDLRAPMPGLVLKIFVSEGQEVKEGDAILILEAMKMENSIIQNANAKIKKILVKNGQVVEKGQVLVEFE
jgi:biotin carboxyl carrier protein